MGLFVVLLYIVAIVFAKMTIASGQSSFYGQVVNVCPTDRHIARSQIANLKTLTSTFTPDSYVAVPVRSEIECVAFCGRQEDLCVTAFWEEASGFCYLANASLHNMSPQSNEAFRIQSQSNALGKKMVVLEPQLLNKYNTDTSNECTSKSCAAGSHVCRKDCDNNMGICVVELRECDEIPVSNIRHWYIPNHRYSPNTGPAMEVTYKKQYSYTGLRVQFRGTLRASYKEVGCTRWYYHFNGQECQNPGPIEIVWYRATSVNFYRPSRVDGICEGLPAGDITVQFRVGECPGYTVTDSATGWGSGAGISLTIEENDLRHSSDTNLWTYGGNAGGDPCVLPFVYNGKSYSSCTDDSHNQLWCATTASYDADGMWGQCPGTCPGLSRFNIRQYSWTGVKGEDNALLYTFNYYKRDPSTSIHVIFIANTRLAGHGSIRYKIKFNGNDCSSPGAIDGLLAHLNDPPLDTSYDGTNAVSGICDNIGSGAISITVHVSTEPRTGTAPNAYTGWKSRSRMIVEEIRYDLDISAAMSSNGVVHRLPEHNIHQWWWWAKNDPDDVGHISFVNVNYVKQSSLSYLRVYYQGALRQAQSSQTNGAGCSKWYFTFNGDKCSDPGTIAGVVYQIIFYTNNVVNDNHHRVSVLEGLCKLDAGTYNIKMYVETCGPQNNAYTCWNSSCRLVVEEVFLADW